MEEEIRRRMEVPCCSNEKGGSGGGGRHAEDMKAKVQARKDVRVCPGVCSCT